MEATGIRITTGRIVHYAMTASDVEQAEQIRRHLQIGGVNPHHEGQVVPAMVVWPHDNPDQTFNGQAFLDGNATLWLTSVPRDPEDAASPAATPGTWHWPERA